MFSSVLLSACSFQQTIKEEKQFVGNADATVDRVSDSISLKDANKYFPAPFKSPTFLPYESVRDVKADARAIGKQKAVLTIKYKQQEKGRKDYVELTVANFSYSFPSIVEQNRFQEQRKLNNGAAAYFKNRDEWERGEEFATLIWKEKGLEYQLLYRNVESRDEEVVKQNLLYIANNMEEKN
ncbi:DNA polymerase III subunit delta [Bacillus gaemokensis]|uniref:DNA polymerase III subunit delta n=1 Tax=Bacillus gaemokensis TaxID=574375 RepID=UPI00068EEAAC|nr:DNA polymerase III subunit delta [Bacillus gaemokensis]KYG39522.1 DNA polymerase III subunit delta [Bacillus gaemokensis]